MLSFQKPSSKSKPKGASHFIPYPKQPLQFNGQDFVNEWFFMKKNDGLSTIVWVSIPFRRKLPSRVHRLLQKVSILNCDGLRTLALVWRVERPNSWFLAIWLMETWPSAIVWSAPYWILILVCESWPPPGTLYPYLQCLNSYLHSHTMLLFPTSDNREQPTLCVWELIIFFTYWRWIKLRKGLTTSLRKNCHP